MSSNEVLPPVREAVIKPEVGRTLQDQVDKALKEGVQRIVLEGIFSSEGKSLFSLLTLTQDVEIVGNGKAVLDGENHLTHLVFIKDGVKVKITGVRFTNGNTADVDSQLSLDNHPKTRLNIFRYLDGGAVTLGAGSELSLENCVFESNYSAVCAGAISNLGGYLDVHDCIFANNHCGDTGAAIDTLPGGSLTVVRNCRFENNQANHLGDGTFGAITAFPNTYLVVKDCDFSGEAQTAIDFRPNRQGESFVFIDQKTIFNPQTAEPIVKNPVLNKGTRKEIPFRYVRLLVRHPGLVKLEGIPHASKTIVDKHRKIFESLTQEQNNRISDNEIRT